MAFSLLAYWPIAIALLTRTKLWQFSAAATAAQVSGKQLIFNRAGWVTPSRNANAQIRPAKSALVDCKLNEVLFKRLSPIAISNGAGSELPLVDHYRTGTWLKNGHWSDKEQPLVARRLGSWSVVHFTTVRTSPSRQGALESCCRSKSSESIKEMCALKESQFRNLPLWAILFHFVLKSKI